MTTSVITKGGEELIFVAFLAFFKVMKLNLKTGLEKVHIVPQNYKRLDEKY